MVFIQTFQLIALLLLNLYWQTGHTTNHPGSMVYSNQMKSILEDALSAKGPSYKPRTRHLDGGKPRYTNRLILEDSPYLLQHAHNPVDWYPWGQEAFEQAKKSNRPVFLSIGYATCHWCHVMEEESFENEEIARILNENYISIKVDREQYPDVDETYMTAVMMMTGSGGWPMSSFLLSDGKPFFGGTYFPPARFTDLLNRVSTLWKSQNDQLVAQAQELASAVQRTTSARSTIAELGPEAIDRGIGDLMARYDQINAGFGPAPKFPNEPSLFLMLHAANRNPQNLELRSALEHTLSSMAQGGIYDQIGGGFHRYATDSNWLVPHFEKMLYNQAYLARIYLQAGLQLGKPIDLRVTRQILDYVLREMTSQQGGFFSATDADSEGEEGLYFVWQENEIRELLDKKDANFIIKLYKVTAGGNFEGRNILSLDQSLTDTAQQLKMTLPALLDQVDRINEVLRKERAKRIPPLTDNKIIVAWNGMLITALAEAGDGLADTRYIDAASKAAEFIWKSQRSDKGELWRVNLDGKPSIPARQDDYAHFSEALLALYDVTGNKLWLDRARLLTDEMLARFYDQENNAFVMGRDEILFAQPKSSHDGATPSGNSVAIRGLIRLARRTGDQHYADLAQQTLSAFSGSINEYPGSYAYMLAQLDEIINGEISSRQYLSRAAIKANAKLSQHGDLTRLVVNLDIAEGWHINSHQPLQDDLIPTAITLTEGSGHKLISVSYPAPVLKPLDFEDKPLALYEGKIQILSELKKSGSETPSHPLQLALQLQACNQEACLPPETTTLTVTQPVDQVSGS